ncbi:Transcription factor [Penicillium verhagenii]|uniref:Transcription factor n=1 Tax=Penicillium verhagenii TaxID=1562060 RepID=UPI0025458128|nr:Transcription factor [Penicillium verhagenii]KAJ5921142.1 Transcription factor [Penicillium verhagenii]
MGQKVDDVLPHMAPPFRIWLRLTDRLDEVIRFYRPIVDRDDEKELDLPIFEELVNISNAWDIPRDLLESLDMFYHGVVILSTHSKGLQGRSRPRVSRIRQSHSIFSIASILRKQDIQDFLPLPMTAYTLSLAFSVTYRQPREEKLPSGRQTAKEHVDLFYQCLRILSSTWWSAAIMTCLGNRVLNDSLRGKNPERSTGSEMDQIRSNSQDMITPSFGGTQALEESEGTYMNVATIDQRQIGSDLATNFDDFVDNSDIISGNIEDFDLFFDNFLDINFPRSSGDQFFLDFDMLNS